MAPPLTSRSATKKTSVKGAVTGTSTAPSCSVSITGRTVGATMASVCSAKTAATAQTLTKTLRGRGNRRCVVSSAKPTSPRAMPRNDTNWMRTRVTTNAGSWLTYCTPVVAL
jgi:hypothetical protein